MSLKLQGSYFVITMENDAKLEEELTCRFKTDMRAFIIDPSTRNLKNLHFNVLPLTKVYNV